MGIFLVIGPSFPSWWPDESSLMATLANSNRRVEECDESGSGSGNGNGYGGWDGSQRECTACPETWCFRGGLEKVDGLRGADGSKKSVCCARCKRRVVVVVFCRLVCFFPPYYLVSVVVGVGRWYGAWKIRHQEAYLTSRSLNVSSSEIWSQRILSRCVVFPVGFRRFRQEGVFLKASSSLPWKLSLECVI
ncbi:hypothetical protein BJ508DRAFT_166832 [Ascobolus immersus RN42]|uniref:Uncharacterized protein n=1 Tax=Ascobolus immersus RN42 TaxID=1160509 RepID=A0A3N4IJA0_ASCIM|nr:hypothetical protein BJ508DRAFT_166832 [Ascobolus immersus RN42]